MKKRKLKSFVLPTLVCTLILVLSITLSLSNKNETQPKHEVSYVSNIILNSELPVMEHSITMINPYLDNSVAIGKSYYDYKASSESQEKSILYYDGTYIQNSGIDFISEQVFDIVSVLEGEVIEVREDKVLGKIVEIKHSNDYVSLYQSLSEVNVKKGDTINQGQVIGKSGTNELDKSIGNHLHFELFYNGIIVNPQEHLNKEIKG